jgi:hypothetical protein
LEKEKKVRASIPDYVYISMFEIELKEIRENIAS